MTRAPSYPSRGAVEESDPVAGQLGRTEYGVIRIRAAGLGRESGGDASDTSLGSVVTGTGGR